jgi:endonuclease/exonuclease/phosphatase family metal-dependent hydrolase
MKWRGTAGSVRWRSVRMRVLSWNLMHGRSVPPAGHDLFEQFAGTLAGWAWDVALLQECPPWWPAALGSRLDADWRRVLTSRNLALSLRRAIAERWPDAIRSNGGGCNAVLARGSESILERRTKMLALVPERRWLLGVRLGSGVWVGNVHLTGGVLSAAERETRAAAAAMLEWSAGTPAILAGDFNLESVAVPGFSHVGSVYVDHVLARGLEPAGPAAALDRGKLSDHAPVAVTLKPAAPPAW